MCFCSNVPGFGPRETGFIEYRMGISEWSTVAPERTVFVIGDIHGCADKLQTLLAILDEEMAMATTGTPQLVFVGDYIDRGPDSAAVLTFLHEASRKNPEQITCLLGNHEAMLLGFLDRPLSEGPRWLRHGGREMALSFGVHVAPADPEDITESDLIRLSRDLGEAMGQGLLDWLKGLGVVWNSGNLWVTHAGADPALSMDQQNPDTFVWGTKSFLRHERHDGQWVAHGHIPLRAPRFAGGRISVDTGAVYGGPLTCARIDMDGFVRFLSSDDAL